MKSEPNHVYFSLGSNVGDRQKFIDLAIKELGDFVDDIHQAPVLETEPWGVANQSKFLNTCITGLTDLRPEPLLRRVKQLEQKVGRQVRQRWGPREIDIDIIFFNNEAIKTKDLQIPHPEMQNREFVLLPLSQIAPNFIHPVLKKSVSQLLKELKLKQLG